MDDLNLPPLPLDAIDPMMHPRRLPIVVLPNLKEIQISTNLSKFFESPYEDPTAHVERIEELLISNLVTNLGHYCI